MLDCKVTSDGGDYYATLYFTFNGEKLYFDEEIMKWLADMIDYNYADDGMYTILDNSSINIQISQNHYGVFTDDEFYKDETEEVMQEHLQACRTALAMQISKDLGICGKYGSIVETDFIDIDTDEELSVLKGLTVDNVEDYLKEKQLI